MSEIAKNEIEINEYWNSNNIRLDYIHRRLSKHLNPYSSDLFINGNGDKFTCLDGPPFPTGSCHHGHLLAGSLKDTVIRYKTLCGFNIDKIVGWDCHGVPIETNINKKLNITSKSDVEKIGIAKYCSECKNDVSKSIQTWTSIMNRFGRWANFENPYTTMDFRFSQKVWEMFSILYEQNLLSQGYHVSAYSLPLETSLSNFESSQNFISRNDDGMIFRVKLKNGLDKFKGMTCYLAIFTSMPWTLPGNCAIAINSSANYYGIVTEVPTSGIFNIFKKKEITFYVVNSKSKNIDPKYIISGSVLLEKSYEPIFDFSEQFYGEKNKNLGNLFKIYHGDFVNSETGTGIVSIAPMYGEDDFELCNKNKINYLYDYLTSKGEIKESVGKFFDKNYTLTTCFDFNIKIIDFVKSNYKNNFIKYERIHHSYPHCWRTNTPIIYKALPSWKVLVSKFKDDLVNINKNINWYPDHIGKHKFHNWLKCAKDWNISRQRYWGTPIPVWREVNGDKIIVIRSVRQLEILCNLPEFTIIDLHRDKIDHLEFYYKGVLYRRIPDVIDCWFESGTVQLYYADNGYTSCDFIAEGHDQIRGWFYTLLVLGYACSKYYKTFPFSPPFKNVMVNDIVLANDGKKMSKTSQNYMDPSIIIDNNGADALRLYLLYSSISKSNNFKFDNNGVYNMAKNMLIPYYNTLNYANVHENIYAQKNPNIKFENFEFPSINLLKNEFNIWIMYEMYILEKIIHKNYQSYKLNKVVLELINFVDKLNNQYIKMTYSLFHNKSSDYGIIQKDFDSDSNNIVESIVVLKFILLRLAYLMAPVSPYFSEYLFQNTKKIFNPSISIINSKSIHLTSFDQFYKYFEDDHKLYIFIKIPQRINDEIKFMEQIQKIRSKYNIPKSKPLEDVILYSNKICFVSDVIRNRINSLYISCRNINTELPNVEKKQNNFEQNFQYIKSFNELPIKLKPILNLNLFGKKFKNKTEEIKSKILNDEQMIMKLYNGETIMIDNYNFSNDHVYRWNYYIDESIIQDLLNNHTGYKLEIFSDIIILVKF